MSFKRLNNKVYEIRFVFRRYTFRSIYNNEHFVLRIIFVCFQQCPPKKMPGRRTGTLAMLYWGECTSLV